MCGLGGRIGWLPHPLRKRKRRYLRSFERSARALCGGRIGKATRAAYPAPGDIVPAVVRGLPPDLVLPA